MLPTATGCRSCGEKKLLPVLALGNSPLIAGSPGELVLCPRCLLSQWSGVAPLSRRHDRYASTRPEPVAWHARHLTSQVIATQKLRPTSFVVVLGSGDGSLVQDYIAAGIPALGVEPELGMAETARRTRGVPTLCRPLDAHVAQELFDCSQPADVVHLHHVLAQVPDVNALVSTLPILLKPHGVAVVEVPYVKELVDRVDIRAAEPACYSYFSLTSLMALFVRHNLVVHDAERSAVNTGSLRLFVGKQGLTSARVTKLLAAEKIWGIDRPAFYMSLAEHVAHFRPAKVA